MAGKAKKNNSNYILPLIAITVVIIAAVTAAVLKLGNENVTSDTSEIVEASVADTTADEIVVRETTDNATKSDEATDNSTSLEADNNSGLEIDISQLDSTVKFVDYDANGIAMQVMVVADESGKTRVAYNTCQTCNGSPYAYFIQDGDEVICQNCGSHFSISEIGDSKLGCNPIPVEYTEEGSNIIISGEELESMSSIFTNWKKGI